MSKQTVINAGAHTVYGRGLWDKVSLVAEGTCVNKLNKPLAADADMRKLKPNSMYYQKNKFGDIQVVLVYADGAWSYCGLVRDKDGEAVTSSTDSYQLHDVKARNTWEIPGVTDEKGKPVVIEAGYMTTKAYAVED